MLQSHMNSMNQENCKMRKTAQKLVPLVVFIQGVSEFLVL